MMGRGSRKGKYAKRKPRSRPDKIKSWGVNIIGFIIFIIIVQAVVPKIVIEILGRETFAENDEDGDDGIYSMPWTARFPKVLWTTGLPEDVDLTHYVYPYRIFHGTSGMIPDDPVFAYTDTGKIHALNFTDGSIVWEKDFGHPFKMDPVIYNSSLFVFTPSAIVNIDPETGTERWRNIIPSIMPIPPSFHDDTISFASDQDIIYAYYTGTGFLIWKFEIEGTVDTGLFLSQDYLIFHDTQGYLRCHDLENATVGGGKELEMDEIWRKELEIHGMEFGISTTMHHAFGPDDYHELIILWDPAHLFTLHASTGKEYWSRQYDIPLKFPPAVFYSRGESNYPEIEYVYVVLENNSVETIAPNGNVSMSFSVQHDVVLPLRLSYFRESTTSYLSIFVTTDEGVVVYDARSGELLEEFEVRRNIRSLTLSDEQMIISTGPRVTSFISEYASPRDYAGNPQVCCGAAMVIMASSVLMVDFRRRDNPSTKRQYPHTFYR